MPLSRARDAERKRELYQQGRAIQPKATNDSRGDPTIADLPERKRILTDIVRSAIPKIIQPRDIISANAELNRLQGSYPVQQVNHNVSFVVEYIDRPVLLGEVVEGEARELPDGETND